MASVLLVSIAGEAGRKELRQPSWDELAIAIDALGTPAVHELQLSMSEYRPELNERLGGPTMFVLGEAGYLHVRIYEEEEFFSYCGGDQSAVGQHHFSKADQGCGEVGLAFPLSQVTRDKVAVREVVQRFWRSGEWHDDARWVREI